MKTFSLLVFCALGIGILVLIGRYASRDIGPVDSGNQAAKLGVVYQRSLYTVSECRVQVDLPSNMITATCKDAAPQVSPSPTLDHADSSSWLDVHIVTSREMLLFSDCLRYGEIVRCGKMKAEPRSSKD